MTEKVKVSRALADAIEHNLNSCTKDRFLKDQAKSCRWENPINLPLNDITVFELAEILVNGYVIEETPEEILLHEYQEGLRIGAGHRTHANAIKFTLDTLGIEIEGINE